jgi:hypothetical protein
MDTRFKNASGKIIGEVSGDVFCKRVVKSKHLLRKWNAWGIDKTVMDNLIINGIRKIIIHEKKKIQIMKPPLRISLKKESKKILVRVGRYFCA